MPLLGPLHVEIVLGIAALAAALSFLCRRRKISVHITRLVLAFALAANEIIWWIFVYTREGVRPRADLPLQLCDLTVWTTAFACVTLIPILVEFSYFAGLTGAGMAVLTPNLWSPWPSYPAVYFFIAHGTVIIAVVLLAFGNVLHWHRAAPWRAWAVLIGYAIFVGSFDAIFKANYMYLCQKPRSLSLLNILGPWPVYVFTGAGLALLLFWLLWLPIRSHLGNSG